MEKDYSTGIIIFLLLFIVLMFSAVTIRLDTGMSLTVYLLLAGGLVSGIIAFTLMRKSE